MVNDPRTSLFVITKRNDFSKLKGFLKHDHFSCKHAQFMWVKSQLNEPKDLLTINFLCTLSTLKMYHI
jgi:hypothetical protein